MSMEPHDYYADAAWISECCGAIGYIELQIESPTRATGICSECKEHASFVKEGCEEVNDREFNAEQLRIIEGARREEPKDP